MAAVAIIKEPTWATAVRLPAPEYIDGQWVDRPNNPREIVIWQHFDSDAILSDFFATMELATFGMLIAITKNMRLVIAETEKNLFEYRGGATASALR